MNGKAINFCLDPDPELGKFKAGSGSGINHYGSATLNKSITGMWTRIHISGDLLKSNPDLGGKQN